MYSISISTSISIICRMMEIHANVFLLFCFSLVEKLSSRPQSLAWQPCNYTFHSHLKTSELSQVQRFYMLGQILPPMRGASATAGGRTDLSGTLWANRWCSHGLATWPITGQCFHVPYREPSGTKEHDPVLLSKICRWHSGQNAQRRISHRLPPST